MRQSYFFMTASVLTVLTLGTSVRADSQRSNGLSQLTFDGSHTTVDPEQERKKDVVQEVLQGLNSQEQQQQLNNGEQDDERPPRPPAPRPTPKKYRIGQLD